ncbi:unnamed protein product [Parnassius apollo]|uniref:(apollo) hypothetical protein n=1 Tax=Parnassius apollo TaxID=110799 RepID=A0A8S3XEZ1_PARAO|nr:unnamed protein product [Parnassius apollo]
MDLDFLRVKNIKIGIPSPVIKNYFRGIKQERKDEILQKLSPLMPENRRAFWNNLPVNDDAVNLITEYDDS